MAKDGPDEQRKPYPARPGFAFPGPPPKEALAFFRAKDLRPGFDYRDVFGQEHAYAFTVAKALQLDVLDDIRQAVDRALAEGRPFAQFRQELEPTLRKAGWWGRQPRLDPRTGKTRQVQLGSPRRLRTIYEANLRAARAAGQWERIQRTKATHPYLLYRLGPSRDHRDEHAAWDGLLLRADDPWWHDHYPPNGWGCKCWVRQVSEREAARLGGPRQAPARNPVAWTNPRTGETLQVDRGLDPAWASNAGRDRARILADQLNGKLDAADGGLARAAIGQVVGSQLLNRFLGPAKPTDPPKGEFPMAFLEPEWQRHFKARTQIVLARGRLPAKQRRKHKDLTADDYRRILPGLLRDAELVFPQAEHRDLAVRDLVFFHFLGTKIYKAVLRMDGPRRVRLTSFYETDQADLEKAWQYARDHEAPPIRNRRAP